MTLKSKTIKFISGLLIISTILPSVLLSIPKRVTAQAGATAAISVPVADIPQETAGWLSQALHAIGVPSTLVNTGLHIKDFAAFLLRQILMTVAKAVLARITQATINWINSDFHGSPLFIQNPESFFKDIAKSQIKNLVDMIGYDTFRFPFGPQTALNVISSYKSQLETNAQYSLSKVINDPDLLVKYRNDFNYGGWNGFLINTQYPQNNYLGFQGIIQQNLASRLEGTLQAPAQKIQSLLQQGMGFLSPQTCPSNSAYNNGVNEFMRPSFTYKTPYPTSNDVINPENDPAYQKAIAKWNEDKAAAQANWAKTNSCPGGLVNTTPGSVVGNHIMDALGSNLRQTELGAALGNSLSAIFDALISHFLEKGLNALASTVNPEPSLDNWTYNGTSLDNSGTNNVVLNIPNAVTVNVGQISSIPINDGTGPYTINQVWTSVATATITTGSGSGKILTITGISAGSSLITISDASTPTKTVNIQITVNNIGDFAATPPSITTNVGESLEATISGGTAPYAMVTGSDDAIATAVFDGSNLVVVGADSGDTSVAIQDSTTPAPKKIIIPIHIHAPGDLLIQQSVSVNVDHAVEVPISGGTGPYSVARNLNPGVATAEILPGTDTLRITGLAVNQNTSIIIEDSIGKTASIDVSVTPFVPLVATPQNASVSVGHSVEVKISGGTGPYSVQSQTNTGVVDAGISGNTLTLKGLVLGNTIVTVQDATSAVPQQSIPIQVKVVGSLETTPTSLILTRSNRPSPQSANIFGGSGSYTLQPLPSNSPMSAQIINGNVLWVIPNNDNTQRGVFKVTIQDTSLPPITLDVPISIQ